MQPLSRFPASVVLGGLVVAPMVATARAPRLHARLLSWFGSSWDLLARGEIWRPITSTFVQSRHGFVAGIVVLIWLLPLAEWHVGSQRAALAFLLGDWVSTLTVLLGARVMAAFGSEAASRVLAHLDSGASSACYACGGAFLCALPRSRVRIVLIGVLVVDLAVAAVRSHMLADIQHPLAALVGAGFVQYTARRDRRGAVARA